MVNSDEDLDEAGAPECRFVLDDVCWLLIPALFLWLYDGDHGRPAFPLCAEAFDVLVIAVSAHEISRSIASESDMS